MSICMHVRLRLASVTFPSRAYAVMSLIAAPALSSLRCPTYRKMFRWRPWRNGMYVVGVTDGVAVVFAVGGGVR